MSYYEYGNTRLRVRISQLIPRKIMDSLAESSNVETFLSALLKTTYKVAVERAYTLVDDRMQRVEETFDFDIDKSVKNIQKYYEGQPAHLIELFLAQFDLTNIFTILKGLFFNQSSDEIKRSLQPLGNMSRSILFLLAGSVDYSDALNKMVSLQLAYAQPLIDLRRKKKNIFVIDIEHCLQQWQWDQDVAEFEQNEDEDSQIMSAIFKMQIDCFNLLMVFQFIEGGEEMEFEQRNINDFLLEHGTISIYALKKISKSKKIADAIKLLAHTAYIETLIETKNCFETTKKLSAFATALDLFQLRTLAKYGKQTPLGIGVPIAYLALKRNEIRNLRWIAYGIHFGFEPQFIKNGLEMVA